MSDPLSQSSGRECDDEVFEGRGAHNLNVASSSRRPEASGRRALERSNSNPTPARLAKPPDSVECGVESWVKIAHINGHPPLAGFVLHPDIQVLPPR